MSETCRSDKCLPVHLTGCHSNNAILVNRMIVSLARQNLSDQETY